MTWFDIIGIISKMTELDELTIESCANALGCKFEATTSNRYRSDALQYPFEYAELIFGNDKLTLMLTLQTQAPREEYALRMLSLGKPIDLDVDSPPVADKDSPNSNLDWEGKYSLCFEIGDCPVWFGIEEIASKKILVSLSIHCPNDSTSHS
jgi:hypothetical protein